MKMRYFYSLLLFVLIGNNLSANVAQPGMWQAGGMENFALLFPEDSSAFKKIQMVDERVSILLYPGFAVVKGEYWMQNDTDSTITIRTGYPINGSVESDSYTLMQVWFEELYGLKVLSNGTLVNLRKEIIDENWYVWDNVFSANSTTKIDVYFLMNTNDASVLEGYNKDRINGFIYILESGASWKPPILKGEIRIQLQREYDLKAIKGLSPATAFQQAKNDQILRWQFAELLPTYQHNVVVNYGNSINDFNFSEVLQAQEDYFALADVLSKRDLSTLEFMATDFNSPFDVPAFKGLKPNGLISWLNVIFYSIGVIILLGIAFLLYRRFKKD